MNAKQNEKLSSEWFAKILISHQLWIESDGEKGEQAKLSNYSLEGLDFSNLN